MLVGAAAGADRHRQHRPLAEEAAVLEPLPACIGLAVSEHAVEPALHHRRRQAPPHRILQHQQVRPIHQRQLVGHRLRQGADFAGVTLLGLRVEARRIAAIGEMFGALARIEAHGVEVGNRDRPALRFERRRSRADEVGVERLRFGMRENEMSVHGAASYAPGRPRTKGREWKAARAAFDKLRFLRYMSPYGDKILQPDPGLRSDAGAHSGGGRRADHARRARGRRDQRAGARGRLRQGADLPLFRRPRRRLRRLRRQERFLVDGRRPHRGTRPLANALGGSAEDDASPPRRGFAGAVRSPWRFLPPS